MKTVFYYPYTPYDYSRSNINEYPEILEKFYDLEIGMAPHMEYSSLMNKCPAMDVYSNHSYLIRSPFNFKLKYVNNSWDISDNGELEKTLIIPSADKKPYVQLSIFYIFWCEKRSNIMLWQYDPPLWCVDRPKDWYVASGMFPVGKYTRNTSVALALKRGGCDIDIKRGDVLSSITFAGDSKVELVKKHPSRKVLDDNSFNNGRKFVCPYRFSIDLFKQWFG